MNLPNELLQIILNFLDQSTKHRFYRVQSYLRELSPLQIHYHPSDKKGYNLSVYNGNQQNDCFYLRTDTPISYLPPSVISLTMSVSLKTYLTHTIKKLTVNNYQIMPDLSDYYNIKSLHLIIDKKMSLTNFPPNLIKLHIGNKYSGKIISMTLPKTLKKLNLCVKTKYKNICDCLPYGLETLILWYTEIIDDLPASMKKLTLNSGFNNPIDFLPEGLEVLEIEDAQITELNYLPSSLKKLKTNLKLKIKHLKISKLVYYAWDSLYNFPTSLTNLILSNFYHGKISNLPNLIYLEHPISMRTHYPASLKYLKIRNWDTTHDECVKLSKKMYDDIIVLPSYVNIDANILHGYSTINIKKMIVYNCIPSFYRNFTHDVKISSFSAFTRCSCSEKFNYNFFTSNHKVDIEGLTIKNGVVVKCVVECNNYADITFSDGIEEIFFYGYAKTITCPDSLVKFTLSNHNNYDWDGIITDKIIMPDITIKLSKTTKEFFVHGVNYGKIYLPIVPKLMDRCDNKFTVPFVPARFIVS